MDVLDWIVGPSLAGCSPASAWAAIPRFPTPTSVSQTVTSTLSKHAPFILVNDYGGSQIGYTLLMISSGASCVARHNGPNYSLRIEPDGTTVSAKLAINVPSGQDATYLGHFQIGVREFSGIYPL